MSTISKSHTLQSGLLILAVLALAGRAEQASGARCSEEHALQKTIEWHADHLTRDHAHLATLQTTQIDKQRLRDSQLGHLNSLNEHVKANQGAIKLLETVSKASEGLILVLAEDEQYRTEVALRISPQLLNEGTPATEAIYAIERARLPPPLRKELLSLLSSFATLTKARDEVNMTIFAIVLEALISKDVEASRRLMSGVQDHLLRQKNAHRLQIQKTQDTLSVVTAQLQTAEAELGAANQAVLDQQKIIDSRNKSIADSAAALQSDVCPPSEQQNPRLVIF